MRIRIKKGNVESEVNIRFWDMVKIYLGVSLIASAIMIVIWLVIVVIMRLFGLF